MFDTTAKRLVRDVFELGFGKGDLDVVDTALAPSAVDHHPFADDEPNMAEHLKGAIAVFRSAAPDLHVAVTHVLQDGNFVSARVEMTGHHSGSPFMGLPPSDKAFAIEQFHLIEVNSDGRGMRHWANIALDELKRQLT